MSLGSLTVAVAAFWRAGRVRVLDLRTTARKEVAELRVILDELFRQVPFRIQSRERAWSAIGMALSGAMQEFRTTAESPITEIRQLQAQLGELEAVPALATYNAVEAKVVALRAVHARIQQLSDKYAVAAREDDATREHVRKAALDRASRPGGGPGTGG
jgi:hypothetical protein